MNEQTIPIENPAPAAPSRLVDRWARRAVLRRLRSLGAGGITLIENGRAQLLGDPAAQLQARIFVRDPSFYSAVALRGGLGGAEAFMDGTWTTDDLTQVIRILARDPGAVAGLDTGFARWLRPWLSRFHRSNKNTRSGSRRNIAAHYDLGNDFFELFLDETLTYSSGVFEDPEASMEEASRCKYERIARKLDLGPEDHVLEIGTGWGGFAIHVAREYGCRVTTTTISKRQHEVASRRVAEAGLSGRVSVLLKDYRDLEGSYDKLVSIEMIEAVGHEHLEDFFRVCSERLRPTGLMALQAITIPDQDLESHRHTVDFIKRYIFPGGELVSLLALSDAARRATDLRTTHVEDLTPHYAETLRRWRSRMLHNLPRMRALGLDDRFLRMWEFYLCYCEGGFEERSIGLLQAVYEKPAVRRPSLLGGIR